MAMIQPAQFSINKLLRCSSEANYLTVKKHRELMSNFLSVLQEKEKGFIFDRNEAMQLLNQVIIEVDTELISTKILHTVTPDSFYTNTLEDALEKNEVLNKTECLLECKHIISYNEIQLKGLMSILTNKISNITKDSTDPAELEELNKKLHTVKETYNNLKKIISRKDK